MNASSTGQQTASEFSIFETAYDKEILQENLRYDLDRARNSLFIIGAVLLFSDILGLYMANALNSTTLVYALLVPVVFVALGFAALIKPMLAMTVAALLFVLIIAYNIYVLGARTIVSGIIVKAVLVYFFIKGFNHAKDAEQAKRDLSNLH